VPTVLVRATLENDVSMTNPDIARQTKAIIVDTDFHVITGGILDLDHPSTAAIFMQAIVDVVSGGDKGRRLIEKVFAGWVNNERADKTIGSYAAGHSVQTVFATNVGTGPRGMFQPGDQPQLIAPPVSDAAPLLDTLETGTGGASATVVPSRIRPNPTNLDLGQRWVVEAVVNPGSFYPLLHPVSTPATPIRLQGFHFEQNFTANLCLWTNRNVRADISDVAERSYGVLCSYEWDMNGAWSIDAANNVMVITPMSATISRRRTKDPLATPKDAFCEVCAPTSVDLNRVDGRA
jgi:hypothetical protein